jgi:hypothetical protein
MPLTEQRGDVRVDLAMKHVVHLRDGVIEGPGLAEKGGLVGSLFRHAAEKRASIESTAKLLLA